MWRTSVGSFRNFIDRTAICANGSTKHRYTTHIPRKELSPVSMVRVLFLDFLVFFPVYGKLYRSYIMSEIVDGVLDEEYFRNCSTTPPSHGIAKPSESTRQDYWPFFNTQSQVLSKQHLTSIHTFTTTLLLLFMVIWSFLIPNRILIYRDSANRNKYESCTSYDRLIISGGTYCCITSLKISWSLSGRLERHSFYGWVMNNVP